MLRPSRALLCLWALTVLGCASQQSVRWSPDSPAPTSYDRMLKQWTRSAVAYDTVESRFFVTATCLSPVFNAAYIVERTRVGGLAGGEVYSLTQEKKKEEERGITFFIAIATQEQRWNDLDRDGGSLSVRMFVDEGGDAIAPLEVVRLSEDQLADYRPYFEYADRLRTGYLAVFQRQKKLKQLRLRIGGPPGMVQLRWLTAK